VLLPLENTTAELLATYLGQRLLADLEQRLGNRPARIRVEVDECFGQQAMVELCGE
jgi:6-pyruvoyltetrahydropterin/6-carboxytetrahydropterin synthase